MAFKTITVPIASMEEAEESWKSYFHVSNAKNGCLIAPPRSGTFCCLVYRLQ